MIASMRLIANLTRTCIVLVVVVAVLGVTGVGAATSIETVSRQSAVATLNDGSAAEQAFIFSGLAKGRDLTHGRPGRRFEKRCKQRRAPGAKR